MGENGDIVKTMNRDLARVQHEYRPEQQRVFDPQRDEKIIGKVVATGLAGEHEDRRYVVLEGADGHAHYADLGLHGSAPKLEADSVIEIAPRKVALSPIDREIAADVTRPDLMWAPDIARDRAEFSVSEDALEERKGRLRQLARAGLAIQESSDIWRLKPDTEQRLEREAQQRVQRNPTMVRTISRLPPEQLTHRLGATWLDRQIVAGEAPAGRGFGQDVREAIAARKVILEREGLMQRRGNQLVCRRQMLDHLRRLDVDRMGERIAKQHGMEYQPVADNLDRDRYGAGDRAKQHGGAEPRITTEPRGIYRGQMHLESGTYAILEQHKTLTLARITRPIDHQRTIGREIDFTPGRSRGLAR